MTGRASSPPERRQAKRWGYSRLGRKAPHSGAAFPPSDASGYAGPAGALIVVPGCVILIAALLGLGLWLWHDRADALANGERVASNLAKVLEEQTRRTLQAVDLTLVGIVDALRLAPRLQEHDPEFERALRRKRVALPYVRALFVIGPDGFITQDTDHPYTPRVSLADRGYFIAHAKDPSLELHVGPPLISRSVGTWFVSMSRRIEKPDGSFGGIAVAAIEPSYFESFYEALTLGKRDVIALFNDDGALIARNPRLTEAIGQSFAHLDLFRTGLKDGPHGTFHGAGAIDGVSRIISYRALDPYPFVVVVGLAEDALLAEWRWNAASGLAAALLITALLTTLMIVVLRQQRQRERARKRLAQMQKLEALGHMTGGIVHDFRNLLTAVSAGANLIHSHSADGEVRKIAEMMTSAVAHGNRLTAQLLAFSRRQELTIQAEDANRMLLELKDLLQHAAGSKVRLVLALAPGLWPCLTDRGQFDAAMLNLVVNAKDAMPMGGKVRIATANRRVAAKPENDALRAGEYVRVTVTDNGQGMDPEILQRALDPFFTTKADTGTGLGLSQVYGFVRQIGGDLQIESRAGIGTSVHLFFPREAGNAAQPKRATA